MRHSLVDLLRHVRDDLDDTITAIENNKLDVALAKFELVHARIRDAVTELRS